MDTENFDENLLSEDIYLVDVHTTQFLYIPFW